VIDTVELIWGRSLGTAERRIDAPRAGRRAEPAADPIRLDINDLVDKFGSPNGELKKHQYESGEYVAGTWKVGDVTLMYQEGRVELRASLPKVLVGRNDVVLDERDTHRALRQLVALGQEAIDHPLSLEEARPRRLDLAYQWDVPSVDFVLEHLKTAMNVRRKRFTYNVSPGGGRSIMWGYGARKSYGYRFYDKGAEIAEKAQRAREDTMRDAWRRGDIDKLLRYELQEKRPGRVRLIHEQGYTATAIREALNAPFETLARVPRYTFESLIVQDGVAIAGCTLYLVEHPDGLSTIRRVKSPATYYRWRMRTREAVNLDVGDWKLEIPDDAFGPGVSLWQAAA
jgi:hypothetical protein